MSSNIYIAKADSTGYIFKRCTDAHVRNSEIAGLVATKKLNFVKL